jgi:hypothetical protein
MRSVVTMTRAPRVAELARFDAIHTRDGDLRFAASWGKLNRYEPTRRYFAILTIPAAAGARWDFDGGFTFLLAPGVTAKPGAHAWIVFEKMRFEEDAGGKPRLTADAVLAIDALFP